MTDFNRSVLPDVVRSNGATPNPWWANAVVYQIYPRSFQDTNGDGIGDLKASPAVSIIWPILAWTCCGCPRSTGRRRTTTATTSPTTRTSTAVRHVGGHGRAARRGAQARSEDRDGFGGQPHVRRACLVPAPGTRTIRMPTGIGGVRPGRATSRALREPSRTGGVRISAVPLGSTIRSAASTTSTSSPGSSRI